MLYALALTLLVATPPDTTASADAAPAVADSAAISSPAGGDVAPAPDDGADRTLPSQDSDEKKPPTPVHTGFKALFYGLGQDVKHLTRN